MSLENTSACTKPGRALQTRKEIMQQKRSLFGPLLLIAVGVIWLLIRSGTIPQSNLWALTYIWPFLLIAAGLGLILRPYWAYTSILMDVLIIGGIFLSVYYAPQMGWDKPSGMFTYTFSQEGNDFYVGPSEKGSGNMETQTRQVSGFDRISVEYPAKVNISQGSTETLTVEADDNVLPGLKTEVKGKQLRIYYKSTDGKHVNPSKAPVITIQVKDLSALDFSSAGESTIDGLETKNLDVSLSGAGSVKLSDIAVTNLSMNLSGAGSATASGTADDLSVVISGFGSFNGKELKSSTADVNISGAGGATVWAEDTLDATISGAGSVTYYGSPEVTKQISGVGGINHAQK
jgi:hypothetical protein